MFSFLKAHSQAVVNVECQDQWGAGRFNKVSVSVTFRNDGIARFTHEYPEGFEAVYPGNKGCDINWYQNQLNVVFMNVRAGTMISFSYWVKPEKNMGGNFNLQGKLIMILSDNTRKNLSLPDKSIEITGINGTLPEEMESRNFHDSSLVVQQTGGIRHFTFETAGKKEIFRIQVAASSKIIPEQKIRKDYRLPADIKVFYYKSGTIYKYLAGEFENRESAMNLLKKLKSEGFKDVFIVITGKGQQEDQEKTVGKK